MELRDLLREIINKQIAEEQAAEEPEPEPDPEPEPTGGLKIRRKYVTIGPRQSRLVGVPGMGMVPYSVLPVSEGSVSFDEESSKRTIPGLRFTVEEANPRHVDGVRVGRVQKLPNGRLAMFLKNPGDEEVRVCIAYLAERE
jgi:hypothetical protein